MPATVTARAVKVALILILVGVYTLGSVIVQPSILTAIVFFAGLGVLSFAMDPVLWAFLALAILLLIPAEANVMFTSVSYLVPSGRVNLHVLTYFVAGGSMAWALVGHRRIVARTPFLRMQAAIFAGMIALEAAIEVLGLRGGPSNQLPDVYVGPILFYFILVSLLTSQSRICAVRDAFLWLTTLVAGAGIYEFLHNANPYLDKLLNSQDVPWYRFFALQHATGQPYRIMTTLGHPLTNGAYFLVAFLMMITSLDARRHRNYVLRASCALVILVAVALTSSRGAIVLAGLGVLWFGVTRASRRPATTFLTVMVLAVGAYFVAAPLSTLVGRRDFLFRDASASQRVATVTGLVSNASLISVLGYGTQNLDRVSEALTSGTGDASLEVGYIIVLLQFGLLFLLLYFWGIVLPFRANMRRLKPGAGSPFTIPVVLLAVYFAGSNTIGVRSTINYLFFFALALYSATNLQLTTEFEARARAVS